MEKIRKKIENYFRNIFCKMLAKRKMKGRKWVDGKGISASEKDLPEMGISEAAGRYSQTIMPFLKIVNDEPLMLLGIKKGDIVGIEAGNQLTSGTMCTDRIIAPKKSLKLPNGKFDFKITKLRDKPSGIISDIRDYLGEL